MSMILKVDEHFWVKLHRLPIYRMRVNNTNKFPTKNGHLFSNIGKLLSILTEFSNSARFPAGKSLPD